ncbi:MAG: hypothetical protein ABSE21_04690 [Bryobacteraceae bacterium]
MVLISAAVLDEVPLPGDVRIEVWVRILPPPHLVVLGIASENEVQVAVAIDVKCRTASFDGKKILLDDVPVPAFRIAPVPHESGPNDTKTQHEVGCW